MKAKLLVLLCTFTATYAVEPTTTISATSTHELSASDARNSIQLLNAHIATLQSVQKSVPGSDYSDQIRDLLKAAFDLRGLIETLAHGGIPFYDPSTIMPRIKLVATTIDTIHTATTTLQNKVRPAHVELGLEVTKAVLLTANPASTAKELDAEGAALKARLEKVSQYPDLTPNDVATSSNRPRSVAQAAIATDGKGIIDKDSRDAVINDAKLRAAIAGALVKAGFSSADAVALAPRIAKEMAKEGVLLINHHKLKALIGAQLGLLTDAKIQRAAAAVDLGIKATLAATIIPNALGSAAFKNAVIANLVAAGIDKHLARATAVAIVATALNPALGPIAKFELIKAEIAAQAALLIRRGVHLQKAAIEHVIGRAFDAAVATAIISSPILSARIVTHLVRAGIDKSIAISLAPHIVKRLAKEPLLAFNTAKLMKNITRQIVDVITADKAIKTAEQLEKELPALDDLVKKASSPPKPTPTPTPTPTAGPTVTVIPVGREGGDITISGKGFSTTGFGVYVAVAPASVPEFYGNSDKFYGYDPSKDTTESPSTIWVYTPSQKAIGSRFAQGRPMNNDGSFTITMKAPPFEQGKDFVVLTTKAHGVGKTDHSDDTRTPVTYREATPAPTGPKTPI